MVHSPLAVANYFVQKSLDTGIVITPMKLVKLAYIAHGWHLAVKNEELVGEAVEAWKFGPVIPSVYHKFKGFGNCQIKSLAGDVHFIGDKQNNLTFIIPQIQNVDTIEFLNVIWNQYHHFDGLQLSTLTHESNTPWDIVFNNPENKNKKGIIIPNAIIREHYNEKMNANKQSSNHQKQGLKRKEPEYQS